MRAVIFDSDGSFYINLGEIYSPSPADCMFDIVSFNQATFAVFESIEDFRTAIEKYGGFEQRDFLSEQ